jgi:hypothetical protein
MTKNTTAYMWTRLPVSTARSTLATENDHLISLPEPHRDTDSSPSLSAHESTRTVAVCTRSTHTITNHAAQKPRSVRHATQKRSKCSSLIALPQRGCAAQKRKRACRVRTPPRVTPPTPRYSPSEGTRAWRGQRRLILRMVYERLGRERSTRTGRPSICKNVYAGGEPSVGCPSTWIEISCKGTGATPMFLQ